MSAPMSTMTIPRFLLPRRSALWRFDPRMSQFLFRSTIHQQRHKSTTTSTPKPASSPPPKDPKPLILEQPTKFNPPSHGFRLKSSRPKTYGAPISDEQRREQATKQYPHMMPPEGSFLHWFLTNKAIHVWITLGTLLSLAAFTTIEHFKQTSPVAHLLPPASDLLTQPLTSLRTISAVYKLHVEARAAATYDHRYNKVLDVTKRSEYRKAHGMPGQDSLWGWTARTDAETLGPGIMTGDNIPPQPGQIVRATYEPGRDTKEEVEEVRRKARGKWFGIW